MSTMLDPDGNFVDSSREKAEMICRKLELPFKWPDSKFMYIEDVIQSACFNARDSERKRWQGQAEASPER